MYVKYGIIYYPLFRLLLTKEGKGTMAEITAKDITMDFIYNYCKENGKGEWFNTNLQSEVEVKVYPKKEGTNKADKTQAPISTKKTRISFIEFRTRFIKEFFPSLAPKKPAKKSMYDYVI